MPQVVFTSALARHVDCPTEEVPGATVREVLDAYFARHARARTYVLDEQGVLRQHVVVFVDGVQVKDRTRLEENVAPRAEVYVMQALSGG